MTVVLEGKMLDGSLVVTLSTNTLVHYIKGALELHGKTHNISYEWPGSEREGGIWLGEGGAYLPDSRVLNPASPFLHCFGGLANQKGGYLTVLDYRKLKPEVMPALHYTLQEAGLVLNIQE